MRAVPRTGWGPLEQNRRKLAASPATVYLLNSDLSPLRLHLSLKVFNSPEFSTLTVRLDSHVLEQLYLSSERSEHDLDLADILLPGGGHHLFFEVSPGGPSVGIGNIRIRSEEAAPEHLTEGLPFDLYQRYQSAATIARRLRPASLLDVGGYIGDENGHIGATADFFRKGAEKAPAVTVTDLRDCDIPNHLKAPAIAQPFPDGSFDLVLSLDVLEHLAPDVRPVFLEELDRLAARWIVLGAPFASPEVEELEQQLAASSLSARRFLMEHRQLGLPDRRLVEDFCSARGFTLLPFPNGNLRRWAFWQTVTQHYFSLNDYRVSQTLNRLYNELCYPFDHQAPCYRIIYLILKKRPAQDELRELSDWPGPSASAAGVLETLASDPRFFQIQNRALELVQARASATSDLQFLINERQKLIRCMETEFENYKAQSIWQIARERMRQRT